MSKVRFEVRLEKYTDCGDAVISSDRIGLRLIHFCVYLDQYQTLLSAMKSNKNYSSPLYTHRANHTQFFYDDEKLSFITSTWPVGQVMETEISFTREEGIDIITKLLELPRDGYSD